MAKDEANDSNTSGNFGGSVCLRLLFRVQWSLMARRSWNRLCRDLTQKYFVSGMERIHESQACTLEPHL